MNIPPRRDTRRAFWSAIRAGLWWTEAATAAGVSRTAAGRWFRQAGGVVPSDASAQPSNRYLSITEREEIFAAVERDWSINAIARVIGRSRSTVLRELRRNMPKQQYRTRSRLAHQAGRPRTAAWEYRPSLAQRRADRTAPPPQTGAAGNQRALAPARTGQASREAQPRADRRRAASRVPG